MNETIQDLRCNGGILERGETLVDIKADLAPPSLQPGRPEEAQDLRPSFRVELHAEERAAVAEGLDLGMDSRGQKLASPGEFQDGIRMALERGEILRETLEERAGSARFG